MSSSGSHPFVDIPGDEAAVTYVHVSNIYYVTSNKDLLELLVLIYEMPFNNFHVERIETEGDIRV